MGSIFISHSSHDNRAAAELKQQLATWGYASVFLDFDPEDGIPAGRDWERELYHQLRTCGVVLVLCSPRSMASYWCFAEITHAKALGKHVVPVKVADCEVHPILADLQVLDLASDPESTARLQSTLRKALGEGFPWPEERSPYPGLAALQEQDAAIFFGREAEVRESLETLERLRRYRGGRALMVLGASGSGKSSLLRAGLLPRLRRAADRWLIVGPFRPLDDPWRELAIALHRAGHDDVAPAEAARRPKSWRQLHRELDLAANGAMPSAQPLLEVLRDLRLAAGGDAVTVLLVIDQAEELLQHSADRAQGRFAALLQTVLDAPSSPLCCLGTLRADLLTDFQNAAATRDLSFDIQRIGPLTTEGLAEVIAGPARIAGIDLEEGLRERMLADAQDDHALPLLAFALRELYQRFGRDRRLTIREYRDELGGLGGSVAKAAEAALAGDALEPRILNPLQDAMLALVQLTETGRYARRPLPRSEIPPDVIPVIDRFVDARLLTERRLNDAHLDPGEGRDRAIEVTHEMLFESWDRLRTWLDEDRELLLWRKRLDAARREWQRNARHPALLLDGPALAEGERWLEQRGGRLEAGERGFLKYSLQRAAGRRQRRLAAITTALALLAMLAVGGLALWQRAEAQRGRAEDAARVAVAGEFLSTDPTRAAQVLLEVKDPARAPFATARMRQALAHQLAEHQLVGHSGTVGAAAFSPDGRWLATASWDQTVRLWPLEATAELVELSGQTEIPTALRFSRDGDHLLTLADDGSVRVWSTSIAALPTTLDHPARCLDVSFGPRGEQVLAVTADGMAHVWRLGEEARAVTLGGPDLFVVAAAFGPEGERLLTLAQSGAVHAWKTRDGSRPTLIATGASPRLARFSPLGNRALIVDEAGRAEILRLDGLGERLELGKIGPLRLARFSRLGSKLLTLGESGAVRLWDLAAATTLPQFVELLPATPPRPESADPIAQALVGPRGERVLLVSEGGQARIWPGSNPDHMRFEALAGHEGAVLGAAFDAEGERVATASEDRTARIWRRDQPRITKILRGHQGPLVAAMFDAEGERVLTASLDGTARLWSVDSETSPIVFRHGQELIFTAFETPGNRIVTASEASIRIWRADGTGEPLTIATEGPGFDAIALAESGIATATWDGQLRIWQLEQGAKAMPDSPVELGRLESAVLALAWDPRGRRLAAAAQDGSVHIWPSVSEPAQVLGRHQGAVEKVAFSPNGRSLVSSGKDNAARVWRLDGSREPMTLRGHQRAVRFADFSPNASQVATASDDDTVRVWQLDQLDTPRALTWHRDDVTVVRFSPDGRLLVSASKDGAALLWRLDGSGEPLVLWHRDAHGVPARVTAAEFSPEGTHLVTASLDHTARIWLIDTATLRGEIAATVQGCLDAEFRRSYLGETEAQARRAFARCAGQNSLTRRPAADGDGIQSSPSAPPGDS